MSDVWQQQREKLNHAWLTNEFLVSHVRGSLLANLTSHNPDQERLKEFAELDWPTWTQRRDELATLLNSAEESLSPRRLLDQPPLQDEAPKTKAWLSGVVHAMWLARTGFHGKLSDAKKALADVDCCYQQLDPLLHCPDEVDMGEVQLALDSFREFEAAVLRLTECIHVFPQKVEVV
ncbi:MAG: hypothetical protein AB2809_15895 [Candidatus Thiodiazotropha sp.]